MQNAVISVLEDNDYDSIMVRFIKFSLHKLILMGEIKIICASDSNIL